MPAWRGKRSEAKTQDSLTHIKPLWSDEMCRL